MGLARTTLLKISESRRLRETLPRYRFIRRAVSRFMPGERSTDALDAAAELKSARMSTIFTHLGENVADAAEASREVEHYEGLIGDIAARNLDCQISLKLTHLGLDLGEELCEENLELIVRRAEEAKNRVWIDMEQSAYVDRTLAIYKRLRGRHAAVGVCLQSYLYRTERDLEELLPLSPAIRLVKGAYAEPPSVAFPQKRDVDANFRALAKTLLSNIKNREVRVGIGTHDTTLIRAIQQDAGSLDLRKDQLEFQMLYGIQTGEQKRLTAEGYPTRVLISYGTYWFPWYVRRLAERPANVLFVLKNLFAR